MRETPPPLEHPFWTAPQSRSAIVLDGVVEPNVAGQLGLIEHEAPGRARVGVWIIALGAALNMAWLLAIGSILSGWILAPVRALLMP